MKPNDTTGAGIMRLEAGNNHRSGVCPDHIHILVEIP